MFRNKLLLTKVNKNRTFIDSLSKISYNIWAKLTKIRSFEVNHK